MLRLNSCCHLLAGLNFLLRQDVVYCISICSSLCVLLPPDLITLTKIIGVRSGDCFNSVLTLYQNHSLCITFELLYIKCDIWLIKVQVTCVQLIFCTYDNVSRSNRSLTSVLVDRYHLKKVREENTQI